MERESIHSKVKRRVSEYNGTLDTWYKEYFEPTINSIRLITLSWEDAIQWIGNERSDQVIDLNDYYRRCLEFN